MIQDNVQYAFIEDKKNPKTTPGRGNRQTTIKKGDVISGFVVSEIGTDRITLTKGDDKMTVLLTNTDKRNGSTASTSNTETNPDTPAQAATQAVPSLLLPAPAVPHRWADVRQGPLQRPSRREQPLSRYRARQSQAPEEAGPGPTPIR